MAWLFTAFISSLLLPPTCLIILSGAGLLLLKRHARAAIAMLGVAWISLFLLSLPLVANRLIAQLEYYPALDLHHLPSADAIVILGAGTYFNAPEYGGDTVNDFALVRLRYGARLFRATGLPVAVSGGSPDGGVAEAKLMRTALQQDFGVPVRWAEPASTNTRENARNSRVLLPASIHRIFLVTHAWHLARAAAAFRRAGFVVVPAGTRYSLTRPVAPIDFIPQPQALVTSFLAMHEVLGLIWYRFTD
ncbi:MAG: YdcF family protein [Burkholderiales bacterium]